MDISKVTVGWPKVGETLVISARCPPGCACPPEMADGHRAGEVLLLDLDRWRGPRGEFYVKWETGAKGWVDCGRASRVRKAVEPRPPGTRRPHRRTPLAEIPQPSEIAAQRLSKLGVGSRA